MRMLAKQKAVTPAGITAFYGRHCLDQLNDRHFGGVAAAGPDLGNAGIAARCARHTWRADLVKQLFDNRLLGDEAPWPDAWRARLSFLADGDDTSPPERGPLWPCVTVVSILPFSSRQVTMAAKHGQSGGRWFCRVFWYRALKFTPFTIRDRARAEAYHIFSLLRLKPERRQLIDNLFERLAAQVSDLHHILFGLVDQVLDRVDARALEAVEGLRTDRSSSSMVISRTFSLPLSSFSTMISALYASHPTDRRTG